MPPALVKWRGSGYTGRRLLIASGHIMISPLSKNHDAVFSLALLPDGPKLGIRVSDSALLAIDFLKSSTPDKAPQTELARLIVTKLLNYSANPASRFSLPIYLHGTAFQQRVWQALKNIPTGEVCSYGQLARQLNTGARAIGNACRKNPIPIVIPCHRVVGANSMGGYSGQTSGAQLTIKSRLLAHEQQR